MVISTKNAWRKLDDKDALFQPAYDRILMLRNLGLCGRQVVSHFISRCIAPLQSRSHPMWQFSGVNDTTRLFVGPQAAFLPTPSSSSSSRRHQVLPPPAAASSSL